MDIAVANGHITELVFNYDEYLSDVFDRFATWVADQHPADRSPMFLVMQRLSSPKFTDASLQMHATYLEDYAAPEWHPAQLTATAPLFFELPPGSYYVDADGHSETTQRVVFTVPDEGWLQWIGAYKIHSTEDGADRATMFTVSRIQAVVSDPCRRHVWDRSAHTEDEIATALAEMPMFELRTAPTAVTAFGYSGFFLELAVPSLDYDPQAGFTDCLGGTFFGWRAASEHHPDTYRFYQGPGQISQFWVLSVSGEPVVIEASWFPDGPPEDLEALEAILESVRIEP